MTTTTMLCFCHLCVCLCVCPQYNSKSCPRILLISRSRSNGASAMEIRLKTDPSRPASQGHQGHRNRHRSIRHLWLNINLSCNYRPVVYRFRYKRRFQSKIAKFSHAPPPPVCCASALKGFPLELGNAGWPQETRMMRYHGRERSLTDGQTPADI